MMKKQITISIVIVVIFLIFGIFLIVKNKVSDANLGAFYSIKEGKVYYTPCDTPLLVENADPWMFKVLNSRFSRDKNNVFVTREELQPPSRVAGNKTEVETYCNFIPVTVSGFDLDSFEVLTKRDSNTLKRIFTKELTYNDSKRYTDGDYLAKDKNSLYDVNKKIQSNVDLNTFKKIGKFSYADKNSIYILDYNMILKKVEGAMHSDRFIGIFDSYLLKDDGVYKIFESADRIKLVLEKLPFDRKTFKIFEFPDVTYFHNSFGLISDFVADKNGVYYSDSYNGFPVVTDRRSHSLVFEKINADPKTFEVILPTKEKRGQSDYAKYSYNLMYGKDASKVFVGTKEILGADPKTFTALYAGAGYAFDKNAVYYAEKKIESSDPATFMVTREVPPTDEGGSDTGRDKNHSYIEDKRIR